MLVQEMRIALAVKLAPDAIRNWHEHPFVAAEGRRDGIDAPGGLPVQAAAGVVAAQPDGTFPAGRFFLFRFCV